MVAAGFLLLTGAPTRCADRCVPAVFNRCGIRMRACVPSQKGLFWLPPQRHSRAAGDARGDHAAGTGNDLQVAAYRQGSVVLRGPRAAGHCAPAACRRPAKRVRRWRRSRPALCEPSQKGLFCRGTAAAQRGAIAGGFTGQSTAPRAQRQRACFAHRTARFTGGACSSGCAIQAPVADGTGGTHMRRSPTTSAPPPWHRGGSTAPAHWRGTPAGPVGDAVARMNAELAFVVDLHALAGDHFDALRLRLRSVEARPAHRCRLRRDSGLRERQLRFAYTRPAARTPAPRAHGAALHAAICGGTIGELTEPLAQQPVRRRAGRQRRRIAQRGEGHAGIAIGFERPAGRRRRLRPAATPRASDRWPVAAPAFLRASVAGTA